MKKIVLVFITLGVLTISYAQKGEKDEDENGKWFKKEKLFAGGGTTISFFSGGMAFGVAPHIGYSFTKWADFAVDVDFNYQTQRDYFYDGDKLRQTIIAPGAFVRLFPVNFLCAQVQYQHNFIKLRYLPDDFRYFDESNSILLGLGYTGGRDAYDDEGYYYFSVMFDVLGLENSPYIDNRNRKVPIIKAGYSVRLFPKPKHRKRR
jgi:hypothetical protein